MSVERTTRSCTVQELPADLIQAARTYYQSHGIGDLEAETCLCCETITVRQPSAKLISLLEGNPDTTSHMAILLTTHWMVWIFGGEKSRMVANGIKLATLRTKVMVVRRSEEFRLEIAGFVNDTREFIRGTLELGAQPAAEKFCTAVSTAALEQNPQPQKDRRRWFGV